MTADPLQRGALPPTAEAPAPPPAAATATTNATATARRKPSGQARWWRTVRRWHWISAAITLLGMLGFSLTGITLNHAEDIPATPVTRAVSTQLPAGTLGALQAVTAPHAGQDELAASALPPGLRPWLASQAGVELADDTPLDLSPQALDATVQAPGGERTLHIDLRSGAVQATHTSRGLIAVLNDLHKGRHTGAVWRAFIDVFAVGTLVFTATGLLLLQLHAPQRRSTWPLVGFGLLLPLALVLWWAH